MKVQQIIKTIEKNKSKYKFLKHGFGLGNERCTLGLLMSSEGWEGFGSGQSVSEYAIKAMNRYNINLRERDNIILLNDSDRCDDWDCIINEIKSFKWSSLEFD